MTRVKFIILSLIACLSMVCGNAQIASAHTTHPIHRVLVTPIQWRQPSGTFPDKTDPTRFLPPIEQRAFECIRFHESRDHLVDGDGSQGWYQFTQGTWNSAAVALHLPIWNNTWSPNKASGDMQSAVAVWYIDRNGRFGVQWRADAAYCPGVFFFT